MARELIGGEACDVATILVPMSMTEVGIGVIAEGTEDAGVTPDIVMI